MAMMFPLRTAREYPMIGSHFDPELAQRRPMRSVWARLDVHERGRLSERALRCVDALHDARLHGRRSEPGRDRRRLRRDDLHGAVPGGRRVPDPGRLRQPHLHDERMCGGELHGHAPERRRERRRLWRRDELSAVCGLPALHGSSRLHRRGVHHGLLREHGLYAVPGHVARHIRLLRVQLAPHTHHAAVPQRAHDGNPAVVDGRLAHVRADRVHVQLLRDELHDGRGGVERSGQQIVGVFVLPADEPAHDTDRHRVGELVHQLDPG